MNLAYRLVICDGVTKNKHDKGRSIFHLEHFHTVRDIREACLKEGKEAEIVSIL